MSETFTFNAITNPDQADSPFVLGCLWDSSVAGVDTDGTVSGVAWERPTNLPTISVYGALYRVSDQVLLASVGPINPITLTPGINNLNFAAPVNVVATEQYVACVLTNRYAFSLPGGWPYTTVSMEAPVAGNSRLIGTVANTLVYPSGVHAGGANFRVSPIFTPAAAPPPDPTPTLPTLALLASVVVTGVGVCIVDELENTPESGGVPPKMRIVYMTPGNIAWDGCECGQLAQTIQRTYSSTTFPTDTSMETRRGVACGSGPIAVQVLASITRCIHGLQTNTSPPKPPRPADLLSDALMIEGDAYALRRGIECCLADFKRDHFIFDYRVGGVSYVGPEGNCAGVEVQYWFQLM